MPAIDRWVIRHTLKMLASNLPRRLISANTWSINLSGQTLSDANFMQFIVDETRRADIEPGCLCFEITETAAVANLREAGQFINELRQLGFKFSLDDFGSGLSSFAYLKSLPVDYLKIDGAIAREVVRDKISASMVGAITSIGRDMEVKTIAEFVESDAVRDKLASLGVHFMQGYAIGKPRPLREQLVGMTDALASSGDTITAPAIGDQTDVTGIRATSAAERLQANL
jgi:EAL domain-containing protein (putative c-di-GMP-specific phosphodiesterase class I)